MADTGFDLATQEQAHDEANGDGREKGFAWFLADVIFGVFMQRPRLLSGLFISLSGLAFEFFRFGGGGMPEIIHRIRGLVPDVAHRQAGSDFGRLDPAADCAGGFINFLLKFVEDGIEPGFTHVKLCLQATEQLLAFAFDEVHVIVRELAELLPELAFELVPRAIEYECVHALESGAA